MLESACTNEDMWAWDAMEMNKNEEDGVKKWNFGQGDERKECENEDESEEV